MAADSAYHSKSINRSCADARFILLASTNPRRNKTMPRYCSLYRWIVERTLSWLNWNRNIKTCWAKTQSSFLALCSFACAVQLFKMAGIFV